MPLHPNPRKGSISPKEKAAQLADQSIGMFQPYSRPEPTFASPLKICNRDLTISMIETLIRSKELTEDDRVWWKEVLSELRKLTRHN